MENNKSNRSIQGFFRFVNVFPVVFFAALTLGVALFAALYVRTGDAAFLYILIAYAFIFIGVNVIFAIYFVRKFNELFVNSLYGITIANYRNIAEHKGKLKVYPTSSYQEFEELNDTIDSLKTELDYATLIAQENDFKHIKLDYLDAERNVISLSSFKKNLEAIIFASQNYRNVLIETYYELNEDILTPHELDYLVTVMRKNFGDYQNLLFAISEDRRSLFMYFPRIDSLSKIQEQLESMLKAATINKRTPDGITHLMAHFALVCYPFSDIKEMFSDLQYAKRQGEIINIYLPNRLTSLAGNRVIKNSMNLNMMSKLLSPLLNLDLSLQNSESNRKEVEKVIRSTRVYFDADYAGIISYDEVSGNYYFSYQDQNKEISPLSPTGNIEKEFAFAMNAAKDKNDSYYFSSRSHANAGLGRHLDRMGLQSGLYYVLHEGDLVLGAVYFFNRDKEFHIDSYVQEALVFLCDKISAILLGERRDEEVNNSYQEIDSLLKLSEFATYRISHEDYTLLRCSATLKNAFPNVTLREKCYKTLYGLDKPCHDCPLLTGNKKVAKVDDFNYETSLVLANRNSKYHVMTLKNVGKEEGEQRYNPDLLINSYSSLVEALTNCYAINGKGYLLLLRIDNLADLVKDLGPEGYLSIIRDFTQKIKKKHNALENIYFFNNQTLALLFTEYGQIDIVNECENIYDISQTKHANEENNYKISITYLPIGYPRAYPNAISVLKQAEQFANRGKYEINKNFIYFDDSSYARSASRDDFMLSVVEEAFGNNTYNVNLQPFVNAKTKQIYGAELLLRIADDYRKIVFRADLLIKVAAEHNKIGMISKSLLEYIGNLYRQYASALFNASGFKRLSLNTDYSFFTDKNFFSDTKAFIDNLKLPRNFLCFEIPESDIANHYGEFDKIASQLKDLHIVSVCDQYTGRFLSLEAIKKVGFDEVKISRNVVNHIDSDRQRLNDLKVLLNNVKEVGLKASIVGVENIDQYLLIKEIDDTCLLQGFYFHRPLEKQALVDAIRSNKKED